MLHFFHVYKSKWLISPLVYCPMVINMGHSICWDINPMLVHLFINKYLLAFINQHINPNKIQITMLNIMQLDVC